MYQVAGLMWEGYAISNAKWTGVRLRVRLFLVVSCCCDVVVFKKNNNNTIDYRTFPCQDILIDLGVDPTDERIKHVHLEGADVDPTGEQGSIDFILFVCY